MPSTNVMPPMAARPAANQDARQSVVIASIWLKPMRSEEPHYQMLEDENGQLRTIGCTTYEIGAGAPTIKEAASGVQLLRVYDSFHLHKVPGGGTDVFGSEKVEALPLFCRSIADSLVQRWSGEAGGAKRGSSMGLMVIDGDEPSVAEIQRLITSQTAYCQLRINEAQEAWTRGNVRHIGEIERLSARWLGAHSKLPWYQITDASGMKSCISCGGSMPDSAIRCATCGDLMDMALKGYWSETQLKEADPFLYERMKDVRRREADRERKAQERAGDSK